MGIGIWQIVIIAAVVVLLFGRGKISELMGDVGKGITSFRKGLKDGEAPDAEPQSIADNRQENLATAETKEKAES